MVGEVIITSIIFEYLLLLLLINLSIKLAYTAIYSKINLMLDIQPTNVCIILVLLDPMEPPNFRQNIAYYCLSYLSKFCTNQGSPYHSIPILTIIMFYKSSFNK